MSVKMASTLRLEPASATRRDGRRKRSAEARERTISALAELLRGYQRADICAIVLRDPLTEGVRAYCTDTNRSAPRGRDIEGADAELLLVETADMLTFGRSNTPLSIRSQRLKLIAQALNVAVFTSLPFMSGMGRVYLGWRSMHEEVDEPTFLAGLLSQVSAMIGQGHATDVASEERRRISRDLHDSTIQPYIGLKIGLEALRRKVEGDKDVVREVDELLSMASEGIGDLRDYVGTLKRIPSSKKQLVWLVPGIRRQARKFTAFYGIATRVIATRDIPVTAALHEQVINIVREGLSNIRRHTSASRATIRVRAASAGLVLELINDDPRGVAARRGFVPRSISERAQELGGRVSVARLGDRRTRVAVELPL